MNKTEQLFQLLESFLGSGEFSQTKDSKFYCPNCHHRKRKLWINIEHGYWHCWVCNIGGRNLASLFYKHSSKSNLKKLYEIQGNAESIPDESVLDILFAVVEDNDEVQIVDLPTGFKSLTNVTSDPDYINIIRYAMKRGLTKEHILRFNIGWTDDDYQYKRRLIVPSYDKNGNINYYITRYAADKLPEGIQNKYLNCRSSWSTIIPFELYVNWLMPVIIVEGIFDFIKYSDYNVIPLLGNNLSYTMIRNFIHYNTLVYVVLDSDMDDKIISICNELTSYGIQSKAAFLSNTKYKDPGEIPTVDEFLDIVKNSKEVTFENIIKSKLETL